MTWFEYQALVDVGGLPIPLFVIATSRKRAIVCARVTQLALVAQTR